MKSIYIILCFVCTFCSSVAFAQNVTVRGIVKNSANGETLSDVSILIETPRRAIGTSGRDGSFAVTVPANSTLLFTFQGTQVRQKIEAGRTVYNINMAIKENVINEVEVTVGYQARKKTSFTGSAVVISGKEIQDQPAANFTDLLQGKVAGLNVQLNNGTPGVRGSMAIRGISNINVQGSGDNAFLTPTSPLFVIDGIPIEDNANYEYGFQSAGPGISPIAMIPTEDIEDITVLKDAQATALYGSKGAYGVILVTTKRGRSKVPIVSYESKLFINAVPGLRNVIGGKGERYLRLQQILGYDSTYNSALQHINDSPMLADSLNAFYNNSTDWQSYFYRPTVNNSQNVNISGGDQAFNYKVNTGYYDENGIIKNTGFTRYSLQMNMQYMPSSKFRLMAYLNSSLAKNSTGSGNALQQSGVGSSANTSSLLPSPSLFTGSSDALAALNVLNDSKTGNLSSQVEIQYEPIPGVRASSTLNYNYLRGTQDRFTQGALNADKSEVYSYNDRTNTLYNRNLLAYNKTFAEKHNLSVYGFAEFEVVNKRGDEMSITGTPNDQITVGLGYDTRNQKGGTLYKITQEKRTVGYAGSFSYNYNEKYYIDFTYRVDGTSTTGGLNPWTYLPTGGLRWNFSNEKFAENWDWLSLGSIRGTWGKNIIPVGTIYDVYGKYFQDGRTYNNQPTVSIDLGAIPNVNLQPQTKTTLNLATDWAFFNNNLTFTYEYYYSQSDKMLRKKLISTENAFEAVNSNETSVVNRGHEFQFNYRPLNNKTWSLSFNGNFAINQDITAALPDGVRQLLIKDESNYYQDILYQLGTNTLSNVLFHYRGVYRTDDDVPVDPRTGMKYRTGGIFGADREFRAGDPIWTDLNGDYILDEKDLVVVGNSQPKVTGGFGAFIKYKQFSLQTNFVFTIKRDILNNALADRFRSYSNPRGLVTYDSNGKPIMPGALVPLSQYNIWTQPGDDAYYPNPFDFIRNELNDFYRYNQTLFQEDGSYLKFNSATFSYNFDREWTRRMGISGARVYFSGNNIYTFSKYSGPDPELVSDLGRDSSKGYPRARNYTLGLSVQF
ncbi:SusC/RagA family TonB-linked outer membrane protein [Sphingobacterium spiritivorum]|uniref:TonB-linked outer membrane protein, SusC/RagA family n=1 Tax=Sphingobacterium spiritivorum ATCC 33861 TaxID=525373 RepID=D7VI03_SPHSI|nr:SusC/RagA family TonB-linked outer membrane protein [Sphingobacterium spiritivorum]EFK59705.1 TonB-linked outer membrane protein, SusC/RagA family [Sphingobacterium spiritivorum ATCC 33861]QQT37647.1 SusC/RagA family TonB-linked outer membrane protein [Sphingobacterium spiritivorum]WQD34446.1 SusC/RagA family TonB-linked outer membrane protein [Sphingobacterium spiritivorum]SUI97421.1 TonB-linked outer membrane protein, SusC/RagA family [Sphingobacterium spiritivorum]